MPAGRPTKMTPDTVKKLEEAFLLGCSDIEACLVADISKQTLYNSNETGGFVSTDMKWKLEIFKRLSSKKCECTELNALLKKHGHSQSACISCEAGLLIREIDSKITRCYDEMVAEYPMLESAINRNC
jgi:hypothetical protein